MLQGTAALRTTIDYSITVVNSGTTDYTFRPSMFRNVVHVNNQFCWGNDGTSNAPHPVEESFTVQAGATEIFGATELLTITNSISPTQCIGQPDGLHLPSGESRIFAGPTGQFGWWSPDPDILITDNGTTFTNDLVVTTTYEFPLLSDTSVCDPLVPNSTGSNGTLAAFGDTDLDDGYLVFRGRSLPAGVFGFLAMSNTTQPATPISFGQATLCLGNPIYRWLDSIAVTDSVGRYFAEDTIDALPVAAGTMAAGSSWAFQLFHRDLVSGMQTANSTGAIVVQF